MGDRSYGLGSVVCPPFPDGVGTYGLVSAAVFKRPPFPDGVGTYAIGSAVVSA